MCVRPKFAQSHFSPQKSTPLSQPSTLKLDRYLRDVVFLYEWTETDIQKTSIIQNLQTLPRNNWWTLTVRSRHETSITLKAISVMFRANGIQTIYEPPNDKTNKMICAPSEDSYQPSLIKVSAVCMKKHWVLNYPLSACEDSDKTERMPRLIWVFTGRTDHFVGFVMKRLIYYVNDNNHDIEVMEKHFLHTRQGFPSFYLYKKFPSDTRGYNTTLITWLNTRAPACVQRQNLLVSFCALLTLKSDAVYSVSMLLTKVKVPSLDVEPDETARMRLWSNFISFCKYRFLCRGSGDITSQSQGKATNCTHC